MWHGDLQNRHRRRHRRELKYLLRGRYQEAPVPARIHRIYHVPTRQGRQEPIRSYRLQLCGGAGSGLRQPVPRYRPRRNQIPAKSPPARRRRQCPVRPQPQENLRLQRVFCPVFPQVQCKISYVCKQESCFYTATSFRRIFPSRRGPERYYTGAESPETIQHPISGLVAVMIRLERAFR